LPRPKPWWKNRRFWPSGRPDRPQEDDVLVPEEVVSKMLTFLTQEGISRARGMAMIFRLAYLRELYCPQLSRVRPGQVA